MKHLFPGALALLLCVGAASANDAAFSGIPGSMTLLQGEHPQIRMESERVVLTARPKNFHTSATFVFVNDSPRAARVTMGYPETNYGDGWEDGRQGSGFESFSTFVNGQKTAAKRTKLSEKEEAKAGFGAWWLKTVNFAPRERKIVRVETVSPYGGSVNWGFGNSVAYHFTGANWKGNVSRSDLEVRVTQPALWSALGNAFIGEKGAYFKPQVEVKNGVATLRKSWRNWPAQAAVYVGLWKSVPFWMEENPAMAVASYGDALANTVTFRTGGEAGKIHGIATNRPQGFVRNGVPFVSVWHLQNRLSQMADNINEKSPAPVKTSWDKATKSTKFLAGPYELRFGNNSKTMEVWTGNLLASRVTLPAAPILLAHEGGYENTLFVPLEPVAQVLGLRTKIELEKRRFSITRATWPVAAE